MTVASVSACRLTRCANSSMDRWLSRWPRPGVRRTLTRTFTSPCTPWHAGCRARPSGCDEPGQGYRLIASSTRRAALCLSASHRIRNSALSLPSRRGCSRSLSLSAPSSWRRRSWAHQLPSVPDEPQAPGPLARSASGLADQPPRRRPLSPHRTSGASLPSAHLLKGEGFHAKRAAHRLCNCTSVSRWACSPALSATTFRS